MPQQAVQVYGGIVLAEVIYGIWPVVASIAIKEGFDPFVFILYRCAGSATVLVTASWLIEGHLDWTLLLPMRGGKDGEAAKNFPWRQFLMLGVLTCTGYLGYIIGVAFTSSTQAALMQPLIPVVACLAELASGTESLNTGKLMGIMVSVMGAMWVVYRGHEEAEDRGQKAGHRYQLGTLALMVNVISNAFFFVLQKMVLRRYKPIFVTSVTMVTASCFLMVITLFYAQESHFSSWRPWILTPRREAALAYAIIFTTALNCIVLSWANKVTSASTVTAFSTLQPLIAVATALLWLGVFPHHQTVLGGITILIGLMLTVRSQISESSTPSPLTENASLI